MTQLGHLGAPVSAPQRELPVVLNAGGVSIDYAGNAGASRAVEDVSFRVHRGERLVLLGPSGCGKSSLLKAVAGFVSIAGGSLHGNGVAITQPGPDRAVVFQEFDQLLPWKTVVGNVAFPLRAARGLSRKGARDAALAALAKVGLAEFADAYPHTLSGGMKQRVAIARAIAVEPDVLLMDEPFAALDALTRRTLQEELVNLSDAAGFTLIFVTHAIDEAILVGTRLHLLSARPGRTIATFDTHDIGFADLGSPRFASLHAKVHDLLFGAHASLRHG